MAENRNLSPELVALISGIAKFIDETDAKKAREMDNNPSPANASVSLPADFPPVKPGKALGEAQD